MLHHRSWGPLGRARAVVGAAATSLIGWTAVEASPPGGYADLVERVAPAVVFIEVTAEAEEPRVTDRGLPLPPGNPLEEFFERFGIPMPDQPAPPTPQPHMGVGSGFLIDAAGSIVTNNHVVANATEVTVRLDDGRSFAAEVIGTDPQTDLALLRIEAGENLPYVSFGDSDTVRPGDNVVAVGNPFGLGGTVTSGIVSAVARDIQAGPYDEFIQIDAAINRGNSGGPLFNEEGEVIGVNTAIFSPTGGNVGIGFAVPSNVAQNIVAQLDERGMVERGWLGVQIQAVTDDIAEALGLEAAEGALVSAVTPDSPAEAAGMQTGDVILRYGGTEIEAQRDLPRLVAGTRVGEEVEVEVHRDGARETLTVEIAPLDPERLAAAAPAAPGPAEHGESDLDRLGIAVAPLDEANRSLAGVPEDVAGVLVASVDPQGPSAGRLRAGDVILAVANREVADPGALAEALDADAERAAVLLRVWRAGSEQFVAIRTEIG